MTYIILTRHRAIMNYSIICKWFFKFNLLTFTQETSYWTNVVDE